jgi:pyruvate/2-oxoglutarate/acetoin dehydrogenase E1 component
MTVMNYGEAIDYALGEAMARDERIVTWGEDVRLTHHDLLARFGPERVRGGLTGEIAALLLESGTHPKFGRVAVESTIPFAPHLEWAALPNAERIAAAKGLA